MNNIEKFMYITA